MDLSRLKHHLGTAAARPPVVAGAVVLLLAVLLGLRFGSGLPGLVHLVAGLFDGDAESGPSAPLPPDPLAALPEDLRARLTAHEAEWPTDFSRSLLIEPRSVCRWLERFKVGRIRLQDDFGGGWICISDLATFGGGPAERASSLFVSLRGGGPDQIGSLRLKLNLIDETTAGRVREGASDILEAVHERFGWPLPEAALDAIGSGGAAKLEIRRTLVQVRPEFSDPNRINVIIAVRPDTGIVPEGGFAGALSIEEVKVYPVRLPPPADAAETPSPPAEDGQAAEDAGAEDKAVEDAAVDGPVGDPVGDPALAGPRGDAVAPVQAPQ